MTTIVEQEIPSAFVRQDTRTTSDDQYINVHDVQTAYKNFNALLAKRARYPMLAMACISDSTGSPVALKGWGPLQPGPSSNRIGPWRVWVPPYTKSLMLRVRADTNAVGNFILYPVVNPVAHAPSQGISDDVKITVTATTETEYSVSIPVSEHVQRIGLGWLSIFYVSTMDASPESGEIDILRAGHEIIGLRVVAWFESTDDLAVGLILVCDDPDVLPLQIEAKQTISGGFRYTMSGMWSVVPATTATFDAYALSEAGLYSITCTPERITSFGASLSSGV